MTPIEKTTKADILNYLCETQTMQFNTRASIVVVSFSGGVMFFALSYTLL